MDSDKQKAFEELSPSKKIQLMNIYEMMFHKEKLDELLDLNKHSPDKSSSKQKTLDSWLIKSKNKPPLKTNIVTPVPTPVFEPSSSSEGVKPPSTSSPTDLQNSEVLSGSENVIPEKDKLANELDTCIHTKPSSSKVNQNFDPVVLLRKLSFSAIEENCNSLEIQKKNIACNIQQDILLHSNKESNHEENPLPMKCSQNIKEYNKKELNICEAVSLNSESDELVENGPVKRALRSNSQLSKNENVEKEKHSDKKLHCLTKSNESTVHSSQKQLRSRNKQKKNLPSTNSTKNTLVSSCEDLVEDLKNSPSKSSSSNAIDVENVPCVSPSRQTKKNITIKKLQFVKDLNPKINESSEDLDHQSISANHLETVEKKFNESVADLTNYSSQKQLRSKNKKKKNIPSAKSIQTSSEDLVEDLKNSPSQSSGSNTNAIKNDACVVTSRQTRKNTTVKKLQSIKDLDPKENESSEDLDHESISANHSEIVEKKIEESVADLTKHSSQKQLRSKDKQKKNLPSANSIKNAIVCSSEDLVEDLKNSPAQCSGSNVNAIENDACILTSRQTRKNITVKKRPFIKDLDPKENESLEDLDHQSISANHPEIVEKKFEESVADLTKHSSQKQLRSKDKQKKNLPSANSIKNAVCSSEDLVEDLKNSPSQSSGSNTNAIENVPCIPPSRKTKKNINEKKLQSVNNFDRKKYINSEDIDHQSKSINHSEIIGKKIDEPDADLTRVNSELCSKSKRQVNKRGQRQNKVQLENLNFEKDVTENNELVHNLENEISSIENYSIQSVAQAVSNTSKEQILEAKSQHTESEMSSDTSNSEISKLSNEQLIGNTIDMLNSETKDDSKLDFLNDKEDRSNKLDLNFKIQVVSSKNSSIPKKDLSKNLRKRVVPDLNSDQNTSLTDSNITSSKTDVSGASQNTLNCSVPKKKCKKEILERKTSEKNSELSQLIHSKTCDEVNLSDKKIISIAKPSSSSQSEELFFPIEYTTKESATTKSTVTSLAPKSTSNLKLSSRPRRKKNFVSDKDQLENINSAASELKSNLIAPKSNSSSGKMNLIEKSDDSNLISVINNSSNREMNTSNQNIHGSNQELNSDPNTLQTDSNILSSQTDESEKSQNILHCSVLKNTSQKKKSSKNDNAVETKDVEIDKIRYDDKKKKKILDKNSCVDDEEIYVPDKKIISITKPSSVCQSDDPFSPIEDTTKKSATTDTVVTSPSSKSTSSLKLGSKPKQKKIFTNDFQSEKLNSAPSELKSNFIDSSSNSSPVKTDLLEKNNNFNYIAENISVSNANLINEMNNCSNQEMSTNSNPNILQSDSNIMSSKAGESRTSEMISSCTVPKKTGRKKKLSQNDDIVETDDKDKKKRKSQEKNSDSKFELPYTETCDENNLSNKSIISTAKTCESDEINVPIEDTIGISETIDNLATPLASNLKLGCRPKRRKNFIASKVQSENLSSELKSNLTSSEGNLSPVETNLHQESDKSNGIAENINAPINDSSNSEMVNNPNYDMLPPEYEAYNKLSKMCSAHGLKLNEIFETKEFQEMMEKHGNNQDAIVFIGTHKCTANNKIMPLVSLHKSKKVLMETLSSLQGKNSTNESEI